MTESGALAYNIDLFSREDHRIERPSDAAMGDASRKESSESDSSGTSNSNSGSRSSDDEEDSEMADEDSSRGNKSHIEVPKSVIQRFFSKQESLTNFLMRSNENTTHAMLDVSRRPLLSSSLCSPNWFC